MVIIVANFIFVNQLKKKKKSTLSLNLSQDFIANSRHGCFHVPHCVQHHNVIKVGKMEGKNPSFLLLSCCTLSPPSSLAVAGLKTKQTLPGQVVCSPLEPRLEREASPLAAVLFGIHSSWFYGVPVCKEWHSVLIFAQLNTIKGRLMLASVCSFWKSNPQASC